MAVSSQEFRAPPAKACNAQCLLKLEQHVIFLSDKLDSSDKENVALAKKIEALTLQQAGFNGRLDKLPDSVGIASSYMTWVTVLIAVVAIAFAGFVAWFQLKQTEKLHEIAGAVRRDVISAIGSDPLAVNAISQIVVNSPQQLNNMLVMVNEGLGQAIRKELRNYIVAKEDGSGGSNFSVKEPVIFEGLDLSGPEEGTQNV